MPPGVVSFTIHSGFPPVSCLTRCHLSVNWNQSHRSLHCSQKSSKTQEWDSLRIPEEGDGRSAACDWVIQLLQTGSYGIETVSEKSDHFLDLSLVDSRSQWGPDLLVQCEVYWVKADVRSRRAVKGRERKGEFAQCTSRKFHPPQLSHIHYPSCTTFLAVSASSE